MDGLGFLLGERVPPVMDDLAPALRPAGPPTAETLSTDPQQSTLPPLAPPRVRAALPAHPGSPKPKPLPHPLK